jgi:ABC-type lipoprotein export system ATPase subunit
MTLVVARLDGVQKKYGNRFVLKGVTVSFSAGTSTAITGASGSGKTTLLHCLGGLVQPDAGRVEVDGVQISELAEPALTRARRESIGYVFQHPALLEDLTVLENTVFQGLLVGLDEQVVKERASNLLGRLGLGSSFHDRLPGSLSGGEALRVTVARALVCEPKLLLADEPTGALDQANSNLALAEILGLAKRVDAALVIVTHDVDVAASCDRSLAMEELNDAAAA